MSLVPSLLRAIVTIDGDALVLHVGDKPYVLSASGQVDLAPRGLTYDAVAGVIAQLLPEESQKALQEYGAAQHELSDLAEFPGEHFNVVAARGGDDVWVEIRRRHQISAGELPSEPPNELPEKSTPRVPLAPRPMEFPGVSALWSESPASSESAASESPQSDSDYEPPQPAVVLPLTKSPMRSDSPPPLAAQALSGLDRLLRLAAARGAST